MTLNDADVAQLAREAVDQRDPALGIRIDPSGPNDPYRMGAESWTVHAGGRSSYVTASMTWQDALRTLTADLAGDEH